MNPIALVINPIEIELTTSGRFYLTVLKMELALIPADLRRQMLLALLIEEFNKDVR